MTEDPGWLNMRGRMIIQYDEKGAWGFGLTVEVSVGIVKSFHSIGLRTVSPRCTVSLVEVAP